MSKSVLQYTDFTGLYAFSNHECLQIDPNASASTHSTYCFQRLGQDLVSFERTCKVEEIQCTKFVIKFVFVETNQLFCSNSNVILTRKAYGHRSSIVEGSKRLALAFQFSVRIWYMFLILKMQRIVGSRSVNDFGTCKENTAAQCRHPTNSAAKHVSKAKVSTVRLHSLYKYRSHAQPQIRLYSTY